MGLWRGVTLNTTFVLQESEQLKAFTFTENPPMFRKRETHQTAERCVYDPDEFRKTKVFHLNGSFLEQIQESNTNDFDLGG